MGLKSLVKGMVGETNLGRLDFFRRRQMQIGWSGPFNGQRYRQRIFFDLLYHLRIAAIVETGTYCGSTTAMFGATGLPVYSVDCNSRSHAYAKMRFLLGPPNIRLFRSDSRTMLRQLSRDAAVPKDHVFFYLDAHWGDDLPLCEELDVIFSNWASSVVMIDDFDAPGGGYKFDDYGPMKTLNLSLLENVMATHKLEAFFPAVSADAETGARRGCVVICQEAMVGELMRVETLVRHLGASGDQAGRQSCNRESADSPVDVMLHPHSHRRTTHGSHA